MQTLVANQLILGALEFVRYKFYARIMKTLMAKRPKLGSGEFVR